MVDAYEISQYINELISNPLMVPFIISMLPIAELRIAIPWAILVQKLPWYNSVLISILGNFIITIPILFFLRYFFWSSAIV